MPCVILLVLKLPRRMGAEVLEWIRSQPELKSLIVIIFSSSMHESDLRSAYELGANAFLVKPANITTLYDICRALKDFWITHNTPPIACAVR